MKFRNYIQIGTYSGIASGVLAWILEVLLLQTEDITPKFLLLMAAIIIATAVAFGAIVGLLLGVIFKAGQSWAKRLKRPWEQALTTLLCMIISFPLLFILITKLASGPKAAVFIGALPLRFALSCLSIVCLGGLVWLGLSLLRCLQISRSRLGWLILAGLFLPSSVGLFFLDAYMYRRLYQYLHHLLGGMYLTTGMAFFLALKHALLSRRKEKPPQGLALSLCLILGPLTVGMLLCSWARKELEHDQRLRFSALELTTVTAKILTIFPLKVTSEAPLFLETQRIPKHQPQGAGFRVANANVLLVTIDALRADHLGVYGYQRPTTPNLDTLAAKSIRFESAYCQAPLTCYSVPSVHTGDYLRSTLPLLTKSPPTLAQILAARGYTTAAFYNESIFFCDDKRATNYGEKRFGFQYTDTEFHRAQDLTSQVLSYLHQFHQGGKRKLFLWIHYFDVHEPYRAIPEFNFGSETMDLYDANVAYIDAAIGRLIAALSQLEGPTIFILAADHGEEFKEHGGYYHGSTLYEEQIRVPLIIGVPGLKPRVVKSPVQLVDVAPTILSLLGIRIPQSVHGLSLVPALLGKSSLEGKAFSEVHTKKMVRYRDWKLIYDFRSSTFELYQLSTDPGERTNLVTLKPREAELLKGVLQGWFDKLRAIGIKEDQDRPEGIDLGRIGDRRAVPFLTQLVLEPNAKSKWRQEAAQLLGQLQDKSAGEALWQTISDDDQLVATEAAIALGEIKDLRARLVLPAKVKSSIPDIRHRAGIALARVDSAEATPALIEALFSENWEIQNRAIHYLGQVGDRRAIPPLLELARNQHLRARIALALGRIGRRFTDKRLFDFLLKLLRFDTHAEVRRCALWGLSFLGDRRAIQPLTSYLVNEPDLMGVQEVLSRLGGIGSYWVPGLDFTSNRQGLKDGFGKCIKVPYLLNDSYVTSSYCLMAKPAAGAQLAIKRRLLSAVLILRARVLSSQKEGLRLYLKINGHPLNPVKLSTSWRIFRIPTKANFWRLGTNDLRFWLKEKAEPAAAKPKDDLAAFDYLLLIDPTKKAKER